MKLNSTLLLWSLYGLCLNVSAQTWVATEPQTRIVILESIEGVNCVYSPDASLRADSVLDLYPNQAFVVEHHPANSTWTIPGSGDPDLRSSYASALYDQNFSASLSTPGGYINRLIFVPLGGNGRNVGFESWVNIVGNLITGTTPMNVGLSSTYNNTTQILSITVEVYYTSDVSNLNWISVLLTESGIVTDHQNGFTGPYTHNHVFRKSLTPQWGDQIWNPQTAGTLKTYNYSFDNSSTLYDMDKCEVVAFVSGSDKSMYTGNGAAVNSFTIPVGDAEPVKPHAIDFTVSPTLSNGIINIDMKNTTQLYKDAVVEIFDSNGRIVYRNKQHDWSANKALQIDVSSNTAGLYFVTVGNGADQGIKKVILY